MNTLSSQLKKTANPRFFVFNPLSFERNDIADVAFSENYAAKVIDVSAKKEVPCQLITKNGKQFLRIAATGVPSVGYKIYEIRKRNSTVLPQAATTDGEYIFNKNYLIRLSKPGVITEIYDKLAANKQLIKSIDGKYMNDLGTTEINDGSPIEVENVGPVSVTFKAVSKFR